MTRDWRVRLTAALQPISESDGARDPSRGGRSRPIAAAVLVPIVDHGAEPSVLLTLRATHLRRHAGQISFPGGLVEPHDDGPVGAALRETHEEIGLAATFVEVIGCLPEQPVRSGYLISPVVGIVTPGFELRFDPHEVQDAFELPLAHLLDPSNHVLQRRVVQGLTIDTRTIVFGDRDIWGATASILIRLREVLQA